MNAPRREPGCRHHELAVGWALHCLEPAEESLFAAHLPDCPDCRQAVQEAEEVGAALSVMVPDVEPPESLQHRILAAAAGGEDRTGDSEDRAGDSEDGTGDSEVTPLRRRERPRFSGQAMGRALAAAAVVALIAIAGSLGARVAQLDAERDRLARQTQSVSQLLERMVGADARTAALAGSDGRPMALLVAESDRVTVVPVGLAPTSASQSYVLWGLGTGAPVALEAFDVERDAQIAHTVKSVPRAEAFSAFAVSLEPGETLPAAPSNIVATGEVNS